MPECVICGEGITNPICPTCLGKEIEQWTNEFMPTKTRFVKDMATISESYTHRGENCIICGKEMQVCSHCFAKSIYDEIVEEDDLLGPEYLQYFNFELDGL